MRRDLRHRPLQHVAVDDADEAQLLDDRHELAGGDDAAVLADHAQQAFVIVDRAAVGVDHRLIGKDQTALAQRPLHALAQRHAHAVLARCSSERR